MIRPQARRWTNLIQVHSLHGFKYGSWNSVAKVKPVNRQEVLCWLDMISSIFIIKFLLNRIRIKNVLLKNKNEHLRF